MGPEGVATWRARRLLAGRCYLKRDASNEVFAAICNRDAFGIPCPDPAVSGFIARAWVFGGAAKPAWSSGPNSATIMGRHLMFMFVYPTRLAGHTVRRG